MPMQRYGYMIWTTNQRPITTLCDNLLQSTTMLLYANKKLPLPDPGKQLKKARPTGLSVAKIKAKTQDLPLLPALESLEIRCEGMKLNARDQKSPDKWRRATGKVLRTDTLLKPILLMNFDLPRSSSLICGNISFFPLLPQFPENPEELRQKSKAPIIPSHDLLLYHESKYVELKERTAFYLPRNTYAGLHVWAQERPLPKTAGLLASWGVCHLGADKKQYHVSELYFGYSFRNLMSEFGKFEQRTARLFLRQLARIVHELHLEGFSHNRLNLDSIFHDCEGHLLVNFFKASGRPVDETERQSYMYYFSPEMLLSRQGHSSDKNDIWAIGCIALQFLSNRSIRVNRRHAYNSSLFTERQAKQQAIVQKVDKIIQRKFKNGQGRYEEEPISKEAQDFIERCLQMREHKRPTAADLLEHPFLRE